MLAEADALLANLSKQKLSQAATGAGHDTSRSAGSASSANLMLRCDVSGCAIVPVTRSSNVSSQSEQVAWRQQCQHLKECTLVKTTALKGISSVIPEVAVQVASCTLHDKAGSSISLQATWPAAVPSACRSPKPPTIFR